MLIEYNVKDFSALEKAHEVTLECFGQTYKAEFLKRHFASSIAKNGQIFVNDHFQVIASDSKDNGKAKAVKDNIFAFGDCCRSSLNEVKNIPSLKFLAPFLYKNVSAVIKGEPAAESIPAKLPVFAAISIGPNYGIFVMNSNVMPGEENGKAKYGFAADWVAMFGGDYEKFKGNKAYLASTYEDMAK